MKKLHSRLAAALVVAVLVVVAGLAAVNWSPATAGSCPYVLTLSPGGAVVLYGSRNDPTVAVPHVLQRHVLAELSLPLERNRLSALVQHVRERATAVGRGRISDETEMPRD